MKNLVLFKKHVTTKEILCNARTGNKKESLFGILNHTQTQLGMRLLRATLVQPSSTSLPFFFEVLAEITTINLRLDAVEEFLNNEKMHLEVKNALSNFLDLDLIINKVRC